MRHRLGSLLARTSFLHQLALVFSIGILVLALLSSVATSSLTSRTVRAKLIEQGLQLTETLARQSTLALLYLSADNAEEPLRSTLAFQDVTGVGIYDLGHDVLLAKGENPVPEPADLAWPAQLQLNQETADAWYFIAPVYQRLREGDRDSPFLAEPGTAELIGYVRLKMSKETLRAMEAGILKTNLAVSVLFALVFLAVLLAIAQRLTTPLKNLADIMRRASAGQKNLRADVRGPKDIVDMEKAFNTMLAVLETRELQLETARDSALESARLKGEFAANVSHELRTPLNGVLGMLELLQGTELTPKQREYLAIARNAGDLLLKLIDDILDFSRTESGKLVVQTVEFAPREILEEVLGLLAAQARRKGLVLDYTLEDGVPALVCGEPVRLRQVLLNLVSNAIKFTERGHIHIELGADRDPSRGLLRLRFAVIDSGIGIPLEAQERIFEAFTQVEGSTTSHDGGAGLGLAICRKLVEFLGGEIGVDSRPGQGSRFWFTLPVEETSLVPRLPEDHQALAGLRILSVDDNPARRQLLDRALTAWGASHHSADNGFQALNLLHVAAAQNRPYHLALVSDDLPGMDGGELAFLMGEDPTLSHIKVILLTHPTQPARRDPGPSNIVARLDKPLQEGALYQAIVQAKQAFRAAKVAGAAAEGAPFRGRRVLIVDDNSINQQVALGLVERLGCQGRVAGTGQEALEWLGREAFDLVLMDCHMPGMSGYQTAQRIRELGGDASQIPIIAMTGEAGGDEPHLAAGMNDRLTKPLALETLRSTLHRWLLPGTEVDAPPSPPALPSPATTPEAPRAGRLDSRVFGRLREETGNAFARIVAAFLEDTPTYLQSLEKAIARDDREMVEELAHCLKGSGRTLGADRFAALARQLEAVAGGPGAGELLNRLVTEFELVKAELDRKLATDASDRDPERRSPPRIVVADDDRTMRFALHNVLQEDGYRIEQASNGEQALALCERCAPDLVLLDAKMPKMDGFTVCARIRELPDLAHVPVLIITALDDDHSIHRAFSAGANDYIPKPVHFGVLRQRVARMLEASRTHKHVIRLAYQDALTGLANRASFRERLEALLDRSEPSRGTVQHAVLFLDLDRFKLANDTMGHEIGDLLLKTAAARIKGCVRVGDLVSRLGGDEFTVLLEDIRSPEYAAQVANKICTAIAKPFTFVGRDFYLSASIGIALYPADGTDSGVLIKHADMAMYRAKEQGNTFRFFEAGMAEAFSRKLRLENDLRRALERNELVLRYHPQVDVTTGKIVCIEALVRWQHPDFGLVPPSQFIPLAEEVGLIEGIGEWVLRTACRQNKLWQEAGLPELPIAINLSARQLEVDHDAHIIRRVLKETGLDPSYLELELTESVVMKDPDRIRDTLHSLRDQGISISIDDFGIGYSSLNHLKHFAFDKLKIAQPFLQDLDTNRENAGIVLTIIAIARALKLKVVAEGVETEAQFAYLKRHGCDAIQGYYFTPPLSLEEITRLLKAEANGGPSRAIA